MWKTQLKALAKPSPWQVAAYVTLAAFILMLANFSVIESKLERSLGISLAPQWHTLNSQIHSGLPHSALANRLVLVAFWAGIGLVVYFITLGILNLVIEAEDEVKIGQAYINKGDSKARLKIPLAKLVLSLALIALLLISTLWLYPLWLGLFLSFLAQWGSLTSFAVLLLALSGVAVNLYFLHMIARLTFVAV